MQHGKTEYPFSDSTGLVILRKYNFLIGFYCQSRLFHSSSQSLGGAKQEIAKKKQLITRKQNMWPELQIKARTHSCEMTCDLERTIPPWKLLLQRAVLWLSTVPHSAGLWWTEKPLSPLFSTLYFTSLPIEHTAKTLIRLRRCTGWSKSLLGNFVGFIVLRLNLIDCKHISKRCKQCMIPHYCAHFLLLC